MAVKGSHIPAFVCRTSVLDRLSVSTLVKDSQGCLGPNVADHHMLFLLFPSHFSRTVTVQSVCVRVPQSVA